MKPQKISTQIVPKTGHGNWLVTLSAAAMAFLAVFALALSVSAARLAQNWGSALAQTATIRISAPAPELSAQTEAVLSVLQTTPGIESAREMPAQEQAALLEPWLGRDLPLDALPLPRLIEVVETPDGPDRQGLRLRLLAEAPGAVYDDHGRWRKPLTDGAARLRALSLVSLTLIAAVTTIVVVLAASAAMAAHAQVISVLRLVGARDRFIARAFVRRVTGQAGLGAVAGTILASAALMTLPDMGASSAALDGLGFRGFGWLAVAATPIVVVVLAWIASRLTAYRILRGVT